LPTIEGINPSIRGDLIGIIVAGRSEQAARLDRVFDSPEREAMNDDEDPSQSQNALGTSPVDRNGQNHSHPQH